MIAICTKCGKNYEAGSEEQANEPGCVCRKCHRAPNHMHAPIDLSEARKVCACVPFIDGAGVMETQDCIRHLIAEVEFLRNVCIEVDALKDSVKELEAMVYHTPPGQLEHAPEGWTWRQEAMRATGQHGKPIGGCE